MTQIIGKNGESYELELNLDHYRAAFDAGMTLPQYLNTQYDADTSVGSVYEQCLASNNLVTRPSREYGVKSPTMAQVLEGKVDINMGAITRNEGNDRNGVVGRLLFPSIITEMVSSILFDDNSSYESIFNRLVSSTISVDSPRYDTPMIDVSAPRNERSMPIAQNSEPRSLLSISLSEKSQRLPTFSIGISITDEASRATTLDLVSLAIRNQALGERAKIIDEALVSMIYGSYDMGISNLSAATTTAASWDPNALAMVSFTNKAYIKWLRSQWKKMNVNWVICSLNTYLAVESRTGRPTYFVDEPSQARLSSMISAANPGIPDQINYFLVEPEIVPDGTLVGIDSTRAITKIIYSGAQYSAIENFVLRKSTSYRFDWSENYQRTLNGTDGWRVLNMTA